MINFDEFPPEIYYDIRPENLTDNDLDPEIREYIYDINSSPFVKTLWSCAGHINKENGENGSPYLVLVTEKHNVNLLLRMITAASKGDIIKENKTTIQQCAYDIKCTNHGDYTEIKLWLEDCLSNDMWIKLWNSGAVQDIDINEYYGTQRHVIRRIAKTILANCWNDKLF